MCVDCLSAKTMRMTELDLLSSVLTYRRQSLFSWWFRAMDKKYTNTKGYLLWLGWRCTNVSLTKMIPKANLTSKSIHNAICFADAMILPGQQFLVYRARSKREAQHRTHSNRTFTINLLSLTPNHFYELVLLCIMY